MDINAVLTRDEIARVTAKSDLAAWWLVFLQWASVIAIFVMTAIWTNPLTVIAGTILLAGRHLGFGVIAHDCGHKSLFRTRWLNEFVVDWLITPPHFSNNYAYMRGHLMHHRLAGTEQDPDLPNYQDYPISRDRLKRKIKRDLTGQTGWREMKSIYGKARNIHKLKPESRACFLRGVAMNLLMLGTLIAFGEGLLYLMWVYSYFFIYPLISRIRQVAEHAAVPDRLSPDPRENTRTIEAGWIDKLFFAPYGLNFHLEHHTLASVPCYRLKDMHNLLRSRGYYDGVSFPKGYLELLKQVSATPAAAAA